MTQAPEVEAYFIRHAESEGNKHLAHLIGGRSNHLALTDTGVSQARTFARHMRDLDILPACILTSPAVRAKDTAMVVLDEMGISRQPLFDDDLQEIHQGDWEGQPRVDVYTEAIGAERQKLGKDFKAPNGESTNEIGIRMLCSLDRNFAQTIPHPHPLRAFIFSHGYAIRSLASYLEGWTQTQTYQKVTENCSYSLFTRTNGKWALEYLGKTAE